MANMYNDEYDDDQDDRWDYQPEDGEPEEDILDSDDDGDDDDDRDEDDDLIDGVGFADPGGNSSLRAATRSNPRDQPCPTCRRKNVLTRIDVQRGYQCNSCADRDERGGGF